MPFVLKWLSFAKNFSGKTSRLRSSRIAVFPISQFCFLLPTADCQPPTYLLFQLVNFVFDRSVIAFGTFADEPDDLSYWLAQTPATRLAGIEYLRHQFYSYGTARSEFRRFFEIAEREPR